MHAGYSGSPHPVVATNLWGTVNCLEHLRRNGGDLIFLSTSRVYPIAGLRDLPLERRGDRLDLPAGAAGPGWSAAGITETFPLTGPRSLYGATRLRTRGGPPDRPAARVVRQNGHGGSRRAGARRARPGLAAGVGQRP